MTTTAIDTAHVEALDESDIPWGHGGLASPAPWPSIEPVLDLAEEMLPIIQRRDPEAGQLVELLVTAMHNLVVRLAAVQLVLSGSLTKCHATSRSEAQVTERYHRLLDERRAKAGSAS